MDIKNYSCADSVNENLKFSTIAVVSLLTVLILLNIGGMIFLKNMAYKSTATYYHRTMDTLEQIHDIKIDDNTGNLIPKQKYQSSEQ